MKKLGLLSVAVLFSVIIVNAQLGGNFTAEMKALLEASIETIKGQKDEKSTTTAYQSTLPLTGFKVLLKETFGDYRVSCIYKEMGSSPILDSVSASEMMDTIFTKLSRLRYVLIDSKKQPKILELNKNGLPDARKILLVDIAENIKAEISLSKGKYPTISTNIYKFDRKLFKP